MSKKKFNSYGDYRLYKIVFNTKLNDKKKNRYIKNDFVTIDYIKYLIEKQKCLCIYCEKKMYNNLYVDKNDLLTLERIDNNLPHIRSNIILSCMKCNNLRSNKYSHQEFLNIIRCK